MSELFRLFSYLSPPRAARSLCLWCGLCFLVALALRHGEVPLGEPPTTKFLRIDAGMHTAPIIAVASDGKSQILATGSLDKTVRLWSLSSGKLLFTLRPPIDAGEEGKITAVAISPDASFVAYGGATGQSFDGSYCIYVFDYPQKRMARRLTGLRGPTRRLVFSPDGQFLARVGGDGARVFRVSDGQTVWSDENYGAPSYGAAWDSTGRLVTSCDDGTLRLYNRAGEIAAQTQVKGRPQSVNFSPDTSKIAVGFKDAARVEVRDGLDLSLLFSPTNDEKSGNLSCAAWSRDGKTLFAAGTLADQNGSVIRSWGESGRGPARNFAAAGDSVQDLCALSDGRLAWGASDPAWGVLGADGTQKLLVDRPGADFRAGSDGIRMASGGDDFAFAYDTGVGRAARFALSSRVLQEIGGKYTPPETLLTSLRGTLDAPEKSAPGLQISDWEDQFTPQLNGAPLRLLTGERARSLSVARDGRSFLLGTEWNLRYYDRDGSEKWHIAAPSPVWAVQLAPQRELALAAFGDGTIRWFRLRDGHELLAFFPHSDGKRWILWTPSGYYDCSPGGEELIGWQINRGRDENADFYPAQQYSAIFCRPDIVALVLSTLNEDEALIAANAKRALPILPAVVIPIDYEKKIKEGVAKEAEKLRLAAEEAERLRKDENERQIEEFKRKLEAEYLPKPPVTPPVVPVDPTIAKKADDEARAKIAEELNLKIIALQTQASNDKNLREENDKAARLAFEKKLRAQLEDDKNAEIKRRTDEMEVKHQKDLLELGNQYRQNLAKNKNELEVQFAEQQPPVLKVRNSQPDASFANTDFLLGLSVNSPSGERVTALRIYLDSSNEPLKTVEPKASGEAKATGIGQRNIVLVPQSDPTTPQTALLSVNSAQQTAFSCDVPLQLPPRDCTLVAFAETRFKQRSEPCFIKLHYTGPPPVKPPVKPNLYVLAVGVSRYKNSEYNLRWADADARDFAAAMQTQGGKDALYGKVVVKVETNEQATSGNIEDDLAWISSVTTVNDVAIILLSGHGITTNDGKFYFIPHNIDPQHLASTTVKFAEILEAASSIKGKRLFFLDACHSGQEVQTALTASAVDINTLTNNFHSAGNGAIVFASSQGNEVSFEDDKWKHGAFTAAILEGLNQAVNSDLSAIKTRSETKNGPITVRSLGDFISRRVRELTNNKQNPTQKLLFESDDFPIAYKN